MPYWGSRGLRGSALEEMVNMTNDLYLRRELAVVQKIPTPITPIEVSQNPRTISKAYFEKRSTVDYIGVAQGLPICFDAKETNEKRFPLGNIHEHQAAFMKSFEKQGGIAFLLVHFKLFGEIYYLPFTDMEKHLDIANSGGRKSIAYESFEKAYLVSNKQGFMVHYLEPINVYLERLNAKA
ncbi:MAG: Holliday junction resolvase RecU [Clostridiales bacterium]|jgi:recombination protein U|nr:Holliday junction resolvase RecU [Clostridiales bacterium]MDR2750596.1 Holliday junction resolvase RecU [Clostridiales bacterium]